MVLTPRIPHGTVKAAGSSAADARKRRAKGGGRGAGDKTKAADSQGAPRQAASAGRPSKRRRAGKAAAAAAAGAKPRRRRAAAKSKAKPVQRHTTGHGKRATESLRADILQYYDAGGFLSWSAAAKKFVILGTNEPKGGLVPCPECGLGQLMVVRSKATRKRFIGCSNYYSGCGASSPLLQKARLRALKRPCPACAWPMVIFRYSRNQKWTRQCSNVRCPTRAPPPAQS